jgi:hypothetical protein
MVVEFCLGVVALCGAGNHFLESYAIPAKDVDDYLEGRINLKGAVTLTIEGKKFSKIDDVLFREDEIQRWGSMPEHERKRILRIGVNRSEMLRGATRG